MLYLISEIFFSLLIAFLLGILLGWILFKPRVSPAVSYHELKVHTPPASAAPPPPPPPLKTKHEPSEPFAPKPQTQTQTPRQSAMEKLKARSEGSRYLAAQMEETRPAQTPETPATQTEEETPTKDATIASPKATKSQENTKLDQEALEALAGKEIAVETLEGVGPKTGQALRAISINTLYDFITHAQNPEQRADIASKISVRPRMVDSWASMADLMRLPEMDNQIAELMVKSGIQSCADLAKQESTALYQNMETTNTSGKRSIAPEMPEKEQLKNWINHASSLSAVIDI